MQDGSILFTAEGKKHIKNPLSLDFVWQGKRMRFEGFDALWLSKDGTRAVYPEGTLTADGKTLSSEVTL